MKIKKKVSKQNFMFFFISIITLLLGIVCTFVLPERFFNDTTTLILDKFNEAGIIGSYPLTILFYKVTGLKFLPFFIIAMIQLPIIIYIIYKIGVPRDFHLFTAKNIIVYIAFLLISVFLCIPSKEFINFLFIALVVRFISKTNSSKVKNAIFLILLFGIFGTIFRPYYIFIPIIAVGMYVVCRINFKNKTVTSIFYGILIMISLSVSYGLVEGKFLSEKTRDDLNSTRTKDSNSKIVPPLETNTWYGEAIAITYGFFAINIPIDGIKHLFHPQILAFVVWQLILFYILIIRFSKSIKNKDDYILHWTLLILFSYFIVQGLFEPDLGSAIRHKMGVFPLIYYALYYEDFRRKV
jgi:hypothetical protein